MERIGSFMRSVLPVRGSGNLAGRGGLLTILVAAVCWGTVGVSTRAIFALSETTALSIAFLRLALAVPVLGVALLVLTGGRGLAVKPRHAALMAVIGALHAGYQLCYFIAIGYVGVTIATLVTLCSAPVLVAVLSAGLLGERPTSRLLLAVGLAIGGTMLLVSPTDPAGTGGPAGPGVLLALGSALGYALLTIVSRAVTRHADPLLTVTVGFAVGAALLGPVLALDGPRFGYGPAAWALLLYLGIVPTALAYLLFTIGMRTTVATVASVVTLVEPLTAATLAWLLFDERLGPLALVGALLLLGAVLLLARAAPISGRRDRAAGVLEN